VPSTISTMIRKLKQQVSHSYESQLRKLIIKAVSLQTVNTWNTMVVYYN